MPFMKWTDAEALIAEIRKLKCRKGHEFLGRIEALQPAVLRKEDAEYLQWLYRFAAGGLAVHVIYHDRG
jgi:hypothetical protein